MQKKASQLIDGIEWEMIDTNTLIITRGWSKNNNIYSWFSNTGMKEYWDTHIS